DERHVLEPFVEARDKGRELFDAAAVDQIGRDYRNGRSGEHPPPCAAGQPAEGIEVPADLACAPVKLQPAEHVGGAVVGRSSYEDLLDVAPAAADPQLDCAPDAVERHGQLLV